MAIEIKTADGNTYRLKSYGGSEREEEAAWEWLATSSMHHADAYLEVLDDAGTEWQIFERDVVAKRRVPD